MSRLTSLLVTLVHILTKLDEESAASRILGYARSLLDVLFTLLLIPLLFALVKYFDKLQVFLLILLELFSVSPAVVAHLIFSKDVE